MRTRISRDALRNFFAAAERPLNDTPEFAGWTVVDFKTDREFEETSDRYVAQVRVYSKAVGAATNAPARGVLLVV